MPSSATSSSVRARSDLGRLIDNYQKDTRIPELFTATIVACLFGIIIFLIVGWISSRTLKHWHESASHYT